jgi:hypothetical protein
VNFDGGEVSGSLRPHTAIEAKFGYQWLNESRSGWDGRKRGAFLHASIQIPIQAAISQLCGLNYEVRVLNEVARIGFEDQIPIAPKPYRVLK